jgi:hypothetical protein
MNTNKSNKQCIIDQLSRLKSKPLLLLNDKILSSKIHGHKCFVFKDHITITTNEATLCIYNIIDIN